MLLRVARVLWGVEVRDALMQRVVSPTCVWIHSQLQHFMCNTRHKASPVESGEGDDWLGAQHVVAGHAAGDPCVYKGGYQCNF